MLFFFEQIIVIFRQGYCERKLKTGTVVQISHFAAPKTLSQKYLTQAHEGIKVILHNAVQMRRYHQAAQCLLMNKRNHYQGKNFHFSLFL